MQEKVDKVANAIASALHHSKFEWSEMCEEWKDCYRKAAQEAIDLINNAERN